MGWKDRAKTGSAQQQADYWRKENEKAGKTREKEERELRSATETYRRRYRCKGCGFTTAGPFEVWGPDELGGRGYGSGYSTDWGQPSDLHMCSVCHQLFCDSCIVEIKVFNDPKYFCLGCCRRKGYL